MDFGDQVALAARIARRHPEVGAAERARYQVVLLDEYQDTSHAQLVLLRALFGGGHPVTAVGDPCQSIYGWRGASAGNLRRFPQDFPHRGRRPGRRSGMLSTSFRNTGRVLDVAAALQAGLRAAAPERAAAGRAARPGRPRPGGLRPAGDGRRTRRTGSPSRSPGCWRCRPAPRRTAQPWPDGRADRLHPRDVAVLCRKRSQFPALRAALERARASRSRWSGSAACCTVPEVADVVATLRVLHDPAAAGRAGPAAHRAALADRPA